MTGLKMPASVQIKASNDLQKTWGISAQAQFCTGLHTKENVQLASF